MERADLAVTLSDRMMAALAVGDVAHCKRLLTQYDGLIAEQALELATAVGNKSDNSANGYSARHSASREER